MKAGEPWGDGGGRVDVWLGGGLGGLVMVEEAEEAMWRLSSCQEWAVRVFFFVSSPPFFFSASLHRGWHN